MSLSPILTSPTSPSPSPTSPPTTKRRTSPADLLALPPPLLLQILSHLPLPDLLGPVACTCRRLKLLATHHDLFATKLAVLGCPPLPDPPPPTPPEPWGLPPHVCAVWRAWDLPAPDATPADTHTPANTRHPARDVYRAAHARLARYYRGFRDDGWRSAPLFRELKDKVAQAQHLVLLPRFGRTLRLHDERQTFANLQEGIQLFESQLLQSFDQAHQVNNEQEMQMLAWALYYLNGGHSCLQLYIFKLPIFFDARKDITDNFKALAIDSDDTDARSPLARYLDELSATLQTYLPRIAQLFPDPVTFQYLFVQRVFDECVSDYLHRVLVEAEQRDYGVFLQTLTRMFVHCSRLISAVASTVLDTRRLEHMLDAALRGFVVRYMDLERAHLARTYTRTFLEVRALKAAVVEVCLAHHREAIKRCVVMMQRAGDMLRRPHVESLFSLLLKSVGEEHAQPCFARGIELIRTHDADAATKDPSEDIVPFATFFAMMREADQILALIQTYFEQDVLPYVHTADLLSESMQSKKTFERIFDDALAHGLDQAMRTLLEHVQRVLQTFQLGTDFDTPGPPAGAAAAPPVAPTAACTRTLACLDHHLGALRALADKSVASVFCTELATRFFAVLCKHIRRMRISVHGGFRLMGDVNEYHRWSAALGVEDVEHMYLALKSLVHLYVVTDLEALRLLVKDAERYYGVFNVDEIYEFVSRRSDYESIKRKVKESECCIM